MPPGQLLLLPDIPTLDAPLAPDQGGPLLWDDFSGGTSLQPDGQGVWSVTGGVYQQTACAVTHSAIPGPGWDDVAVSVKLRPNALCSGLSRQVGLTVRVTGSGACGQWDFYACVIDVDGNKIFMCHLDNSCSCTTYGALSTSTLKTGTWYDLVFTAQANNLTCTVSGPGIAPVTVTHTDTAVTANASGSAGLVTAGVNVSFDDLRVEAL